METKKRKRKKGIHMQKKNKTKKPHRFREQISSYQNGRGIRGWLGQMKELAVDR